MAVSEIQRAPTTSQIAQLPVTTLGIEAESPTRTSVTPDSSDFQFECEPPEPRSHDRPVPEDVDLVLIDRVGSGSSSEVFRAYRRSARRMVAAKVWKRNPNPRTHEDVRLARELRSLRWVDHRHVVRFLGTGLLNDGRPYIETEWLEGRDLAHWQAVHGPIPQELCLRWLSQVCDGLAALHDLGLVHRDIKPSNLGLCRRAPTSDAKLLDLGLSKSLYSDEPEITRAGSIVGSAHYMPPEQARGEKVLQPSSDLYALAATAVHLMSGRTMYERATWVEVAVAQIQAPVIDVGSLLPSLPRSCVDLLTACLQKDPAARPHSAREIIQLW